MWFQFLLENSHFALNLFAALILFAIGWLYSDAWLGRKTFKEGIRVAGFFVLAISFVIHSTVIESTVLTNSFNQNISSMLFILSRVCGYLLIIISLILDPIQERPNYESKKSVIHNSLFMLPAQWPIFKFLPIALPVLSALVGFLYLRRATVGLENHIKRVAFGFFLLSISELLSLGSLLQGTNNVDLFKLVAPFSPLWALEHLFLLAAIFVLGKWVFGYLLKRLQTQLFMILTSTTLIIFLLVTVNFTALLLKNLQAQSLKQLETDVKVLDYALESKKASILSDAQMLAQNPQLQAALEQKDQTQLQEIAQGALLSKSQSTLLVLDGNGQVLIRAEDKDRKGDSLSDDSLIKRALAGQSAVSVVTKDGAVAPQVNLRACAPIKKGDQVIGVVLTGIAVDNALVDGIKTATGLETSVYADKLLSATTFVSSDNKSRLLGMEESDQNILNKVLGSGESYTGSVSILNTPYFGAFMPLKDIDNTPAGMLFVGSPQAQVLAAASRSINLTFIVAAILLCLSIFPAYLTSKFISDQVR
jgi:hypothetical protein